MGDRFLPVSVSLSLSVSVNIINKDQSMINERVNESLASLWARTINDRQWLELQCCSQSESEWVISSSSFSFSSSARSSTGHCPMATANDPNRERSQTVRWTINVVVDRRLVRDLCGCWCCCCCYCCSLVAFHSWLFFFACCLATSSSNKHYEHAHYERLVLQSHNQLPATVKAPQTKQTTAKAKAKIK